MKTHLRHHVVFSCHGDDIESDNTGNGKVKIFAVCNCVNEEAYFTVVRPVGQFFQF